MFPWVTVCGKLIIIHISLFWIIKLEYQDHIPTNAVEFHKSHTSIDQFSHVQMLLEHTNWICWWLVKLEIPEFQACQSATRTNFKFGSLERCLVNGSIKTLSQKWGSLWDPTCPLKLYSYLTMLQATQMKKNLHQSS